MAVMQKMNMKMRSRSAGVRIAPASRRSMLKPARCAAPEGDKPAAATPEPAAPSMPAAAPSVSFGDVMGFSGLAPERVNGRLAMLGFVAAAAAELSSNEPLSQQVSEASGPIAGAFLVFIAASLVPLLRGAKLESFGPFTPAAEMLNGRAAMLGFLLLIGFEAGSGAALF